MTDKLTSCPECHRHVFERDTVCPFCAAKMQPLRRAVATVAAVALSMAAAACGDKPAPIVPGVSTPDGGSIPASSVPEPKRGDQAPAPVYGGPPP